MTRGVAVGNRDRKKEREGHRQRGEGDERERQTQRQAASEDEDAAGTKPDRLVEMGLDLELDRRTLVVPDAIAIAPIQSQGKVIGVLEAINPISGAFDPDAMIVMTGLGSQGALRPVLSAALGRRSRQWWRSALGTAQTVSVDSTILPPGTRHLQTRSGAHEAAQ